MMKGSKKKLAGILALLLLVTVFAFTGCGGSTCEHQWNEATCTLPKTCSLCGVTEGEALGHEWTTPDVDLCEVQSTCSRCGATDGENKEHTWSCDAATEEHDKHCTVCGYVAQEQLGHTHANNLTPIAAVLPGCETEGSIAYWTCSCGKWFSDSAATTEITNHGDVVVGAVGHNHSSEWSENATQHWHECACCDKKDVADHTWNYDAATEEHDKHCTVCGYVAQAQIGHIHQFEAVLSYDEEGHYYASTCGHADAKKDYATHDYESAVTPPTCTEQGFTTYTCDCGKSYKDDYTPAAGHSYKATLSYDSGGHWYQSDCEHNVTKDYATHTFESAVTEPTCTEQGYTTYSCACGYSYVGDYVSETGHSVANWSEGTSSLYDAETCKHAVSYTGICSTCGAPLQKTEYVEKHAWTYTVKEGFEADCQHSGLKLQFCKNEACKYYGTAKGEVPYSDADAHVWVVDDVQSIDGMTSYHCSIEGCDATKNTVSTDGTSATVSSENVGSLDEVELDNATIGFDQNVKDTLSSSGSNVAISAGTLEGDDRTDAINRANLTPEQEALLGDKEIYNFTVTTTEDIHNLGGTATIRIPYELNGEDPDNIIVWYISDGELKGVPATYADGYVTFTTTHFSYYVATTIAPDRLCRHLNKHDLTNVHTVLPTCTEGGYTICIRCGKQIEGSETAPLGHEWHTSVIAEKDCTTNGVTKYECTRCDFHYETLVGATGHYYVLTAQSNASCSQSGSATYGCIYCDSEYTVTLPQLNHTYTTNVIAPTCEERGYTEKTCLTCGDTLYTNYQDAIGHSYDTVWHTSPEGHYHNCTVCGKAGDATKHTPGAEATEQSAQICTVCEYVITPQLSHSHSLKKTEANAASCLENGNIAYYTCACGKWFLDANGEQLITDHSAVIVLAQGHTHEAIPYVEPTCTEVGYTAGIRCSACNTVLRGHVELPAYGHDYVTTETAPTCTEAGSISKVCSACGDTLDGGTIPKLEHKHVIGSIKAPTCTEAGFTTYSCVYCGDSYTGAEKSALGHTYSDTWITDEGGHWHECTRCQEKSDEAEHTPGAEATEVSAQLCTVCEFVIEPIKNHVHTPSVTVSEKAPTCDSVGNITYYICSCGEWYYDEACEKIILSREDVIAAALGHDLTLIEEQAPTCTEGGYSAGYYCNRCERYLSGHEGLDALGHSYAYGECTNCGEKDPDYVPKTNTIEVVRFTDENGTALVQINVKNVDFAGIRLRISYKGYEFSDASCSENAQYFNDGSICNFVWSSGINVTTDELELLNVQFTVEDGLETELTLVIVEIYEFADDGSLAVPDYEIIYRK